YLDPNRGQFITEDGKFITATQSLGDPQKLNAYSYGRDNPIALFDVSGLDSAYFAARVAQTILGISGYHIYESYSIDSQAVANQLNIGVTVPKNVSQDNPFDFTIGFEPTKHGFSSIGSPLVMSVESANGETDPTSMFGDYADAAAHKFASTGANL